MLPLLFPLVYLVAVLETWLSPRWAVGGASPDLLALVAFVWLATAMGGRAFIVAAWVGLVSDLGSAGPLGIGMAAYAAVGFTVVFLRQNLHLERFAARLAIVWFGTTFTCLLQGLTLLLLGYIALPWLVLIERVALVGLYTTGPAVPLLMMVNWLRNEPFHFPSTSP